MNVFWLLQLCKKDVTVTSLAMMANSYLMNRNSGLFWIWPMNAPIPKGLELHVVPQVVSIFLVPHTLPDWYTSPAQAQEVTARPPNFEFSSCPLLKGSNFHSETMPLNFDACQGCWQPFLYLWRWHCPGSLSSLSLSLHLSYPKSAENQNWTTAMGQWMFLWSKAWSWNFPTPWMAPVSL